MLAADAVSIEFLQVEGTTLLRYCEEAIFGGAGDEQHAAQQKERDEHAHDHTGADPHAWLNPKNVKVWLDAIAAELSAIDPKNVALYQQNARMGNVELDALTDGTAVTTAELDPLGANLKAGAKLYPSLLRKLGENLAKCLG